MTTNPFTDKSPLNLPLPIELCQELHAAALRSWSRGAYSGDLRSVIDADRLRSRLRLQGQNGCFVHPADIEAVFAGVTLAVYQAIGELYCDGLGRSMTMTSNILAEMAISAGHAPVAHEAVWSICLHLDRRRKDSLNVSREPLKSSWILTRNSPDVLLRDDGDAPYRPAITFIVGTDRRNVLSFRIGRLTEVDKDAALAIYDALVTLRRPAPDGTGGLIWPIPKELCAEVRLLPQSTEICEHMGIRVRPAPEEPAAEIPVICALKGTWTRDLARIALTADSFSMILDNYLAKVHGHGPREADARRTRDLRHLVGFNRDPAWQNPALRQFLPVHRGTIDADGAVEFDGLHYEDDLLKYWPGHRVQLRRSEQAEATAWVYLDGEVLCQAMARELRRKDGAHRPNRPGRYQK